MKANVIKSIMFYLFILSIISCSKPDEKNDMIYVKGKAYDLFRKQASPDVKVMLYERKIPTQLFGDCVTYKVDSTLTDTEGKYEISYKPLKDRVYLIAFYNNNYKQYCFEEIENGLRIEHSGSLFKVNLEKGENKVDVNAYKTNVIKVNAHVSNNINKKLKIDILKPGYRYCISNNPSIYVASENIDTVFYLHSRPNSSHLISFEYFRSPGQADWVRKIFDTQTTLADTLTLSYDIDCSLP